MKPLSLLLLLSFLAGCARQPAPPSLPVPKRIVDLGVVVTEDTPERFWGKRMLEDSGFEAPNRFDVIHWDYGPVSGTNSYFRLFNHGGPHVDAPGHVGLGPGLDGLPVEAFAGPLKVFDVSHLPPGRTITLALVSSLDIAPGDIVAVYTGYRAPASDAELPTVTALSHEAARYLAGLPIRAFVTDAFSAEALSDASPVASDDPVARVIPVHEPFLGRGIPIFEQLVNLDALLGQTDLYFVGVPLNIADADGMMVRPVVLVY